MYLALWLIRRCRLPATPAFSLPEAVILKRFLAPDFVFSFGISRRSRSPVLLACLRTAMACLEGQAAPKGRADTRKAARTQGWRGKWGTTEGTENTEALAGGGGGAGVAAGFFHEPHEPHERDASGTE